MATEWKKHFRDNDRCTDPTAEIKIAGKKLTAKEAYITSIFVMMTTGCEASTCEVQLKLPRTNFKKDKLKLPSDFAKAKLGVEFEIALGYNVNKKSKLETVFIGYITDFSVEVDKNGDGILTIRGMDARVWMMSSRRSELKKEKKKYSDIVADMYSKYSSKLKSKVISISKESAFESPIYQRNESDYEFLCRAASITGTWFFVSLGKMYFISAQTNKAVKLKVTPTLGVYKVKADWSIWNIPGAVRFIGIDPKDFTKTIEAKATSSDNIGVGKSAKSLTSNISDINTVTVVDNTVQSVGEAKFLAEAQYAARDLNLVKGELYLAGIPTVELATGLKLENFGDPIDNSYIIQGIKHICDLKNRVYTTKIEVVTNRFNPQTESLF